jgi:hypothetical protein
MTFLLFFDALSRLWAFDSIITFSSGSAAVNLIYHKTRAAAPPGACYLGKQMLLNKISVAQ